MLDGDASLFENEISIQLRNTISYMDSSEAFYHGFMHGIMANLSGYIKRSNRESGDGRYDIRIHNHDVSITTVILELKVA